MSTIFKAACVQTNTGADPDEGMRAVADGVCRARDAGAAFITTPENVLMIEARRAAVLEKAEEEAEHRGIAGFRALARETGAWLLAGSLTVKVEADRVANRSMLFDPQGNVVASYDKMHMFDVDLEGGESYRESRTYRPGEQAVMAALPWCELGMTICYDMRFPYLYRDLAHAGAKLLTVPSAFTRPTGRAHWHVLLRARAVETGCFVIAAAQCGEHAAGRKTYGHSLIVDPWGTVLADGGEEPGIVVADIDLAKVDEARRMVPSLQHDRTYPRLTPHASAAE
ncbi:MAG: carbon-nitrogen hydrolase family protein [Alphaproteobacteria bacterium]